MQKLVIAFITVIGFGSAIARVYGNELNYSPRANMIIAACDQNATRVSDAGMSLSG
jgi:hypothetical protein